MTTHHEIAQPQANQCRTTTNKSTHTPSIVKLTNLAKTINPILLAIEYKRERENKKNGLTSYRSLTRSIYQHFKTSLALCLGIIGKVWISRLFVEPAASALNTKLEFLSY